MKSPAALFLVATLLLALGAFGCSRRSISDSEYRKDSVYGGRQSAPAPFRGELSEFDVLGINPGEKASDEEIRRALESRRNVALPKDSGIMLIQSGAMIPDAPMSKALEKYYKVSVFSGIPEGSGSSYAAALRLAAAMAGCDAIMVYWGMLETAKTVSGSKLVSWTPVIGAIVPDEAQQMRICLKVALIDVKTAYCELFAPEPFQDSAWSSHLTRESSDQAQVAGLKLKAYEAAVEDIVKRFAVAQ